MRVSHQAPSPVPGVDTAGPASRQSFWIVLAATAVGGALRAYHVLVQHPPPHFLFGEMLASVNRYYAFYEHRPFLPEGSLFPPGLTWLGAFALHRRWGQAGEWLAPWQALVSAASIPLAYLGLRRFFGSRAAAWGAALLAIDPLAIGLAGFFVPDPYLAFFLVAAFALLRPGRPVSCLLSGAALGAASLFGAPALALAALWALALWVAKAPARRLSSVALVLGVLAVVVPESVGVSRQAHQAVVLASGAGAEFYADHCRLRPVGRVDPLAAPQPLDPELPGSDAWPAVAVAAPLSRTALYFREGLRCASGSPWDAAASTGHQLLGLLGAWPPGSFDVWPLGTGDDLPWARAGNLIAAWLLLPLALWGLFRRRRLLEAWLGFGLPLLAPALVAVVFAGSPRLRAAFDPFLFGAAAWAGFSLWEGRAGERLRAFLRGPWSAPLLAGEAASEAAPARRWTTPLAMLVVAGLALAVCFPLTRLWWFDSHEWAAYPLRLFEWVENWRDGHLFPRWAQDLCGGFGSPFFEYYAPGVFLGAGPFVLLGVPVQLAMKIWIALVGVAGSLGAFLLVRGETRRDDAGLVAAASFAFTPYRFVNLYMRGDIAEYAAMSLIPLVLWCYRELARCRPERRAAFALGAAASHALLLVSHTITGQWATEALAIVALISVTPAWARGDRRPALAAALALCGAAGLAAFYVVPALLEKKLAHLELLTGGYYTATDHLVPAKLFFRFRYFDFTGDGSFRDPKATRMPFTVGVPLAAGGLLALGSLFGRASRRRLEPGLLWWASVAVLLFLMTPAAETLWPALPFGNYIGFPWRLLALVGAFGAAAVGAAWAAAVSPARRWRWPLALAAVAAIGAEGEHYVRIGPAVPPPPHGVDAAYIQKCDSWLVCLGEHLPVGATFLPPRKRTRLVEALPGVQKAEAVQPRSNEYDIEADATRAGDLDVQSYWFPGWKVELRSGPARPTLSQSPLGLLRVHLPAAGHYRLHVAFGRTPLRAVAEGLSLLTLLLVWPLFRLALRPRAAPEERPEAAPTASLPA
ncbi:MAG: phospholipid carrier-dependent glycosyltransferase [Myxococcales bacterium]